MSSRSSGPANRPAVIALCMMLVATGIAVLAAATAHASPDSEPSTPPAPLNLKVLSANPGRYLSHFAAVFSVPADSSSPVIAVRYDIVDATGKIVVPEHLLYKTGITEIPDVAAPPNPGDYTLRVWLQGEDNPFVNKLNIGPAASVQIPRDTTPPGPPQELAATAPNTSRGEVGFDVRWHDLPDNGSPVDSVRYEVLDTTGHVIVPETAVPSEDPHEITDLRTPEQAGTYVLRVWLVDAEGNVGPAASVPLAFDCLRADAQGGTALSIGFDDHAGSREIVQQGEDATLAGTLTRIVHQAPRSNGSGRETGVCT
jgi:hypothetical protein